MGREIKRVPMDFVFPIGGSYHDAAFDQHRATCPKGAGWRSGEHDECDDWSDDPPEGSGWQLWQTVSDGPVTPVFPTPDALIEWMCQPVPVDERPEWAPEPFPAMPAGQGWRREVAEPFVRGKGWAPAFVIADGRMMSGAEYVTREQGK